MTQRDHATLDAALRAEFLLFAMKAFEVLKPGKKLVENWHLDAIAYALQKMQKGLDQRLIINLPPRMLKSFLVSIAWPAYLLGLNPSERIMVVSYSESLAEELSIDARRLMQSDFYKRIFPGTRLDRRRSDVIDTDRGGTRFATTIGGAVTGLGGGWIILDDPHNASEAHWLSARNRVGNFFKASLLSRLDDPAEGRIIVVMQRVHEDDISGRLISQGGWQHLKLSARATEDQTIAIDDDDVEVVKIGDLLMPSRLTGQVLEEQRRTMGAVAFAAQYLQEPTPAEGGMIKRAWLKYSSPPVEALSNVTISLDAALKSNPESDYSVATVWGEHGGVHYLLDVWREKVNFTSLHARMISLYQDHGARRVIIEDAAAGVVLIQMLKSQGVPVIAHKVRESKESRLSMAQPYIEGGQMVLPLDAPWLADLEAELFSFPGGRYDDQVDSVSQYLNDWRSRSQAGSFEAWFW